MFTKTQYLKKINLTLNLLTLQIASDNKLSLTDDNHWAEDFFVGFFNIMYDSNLINLNIKERNYPGIDLGDEKKRICIQVTSTSDSSKIKETLQKSDKYKHQNKFDKLKVFIIGHTQPKYRAEFETKFDNFDPDSDIFNTQDLIEKIRTLETAKLEKLSDFIKREVSHDHVLSLSPIELTDEDLVLLIDEIFKSVSEKHNDDGTGKVTFRLGERGDDFINRKNELNGVDCGLFNDEIIKSLPYDKKIEEFLGNPINSEYLKKYLSSAQEIQSRYSDNKEKFPDMKSLFSYVYTELMSYENRNIDNTKLLILLHNMYFNCDIGNNP